MSQDEKLQITNAITSKLFSSKGHSKKSSIFSPTSDSTGIGFLGTNLSINNSKKVTMLR